jgi:hypothetical protein
MSMLNKFVAPELKIKAKGSKGSRGTSGKPKQASKPNFGVTAAAKSGMTVNSIGSLKTQVSSQGAQGGGGGKR